MCVKPAELLSVCFFVCVLCVRVCAGWAGSGGPVAGWMCICGLPGYPCARNSTGPLLAVAGHLPVCRVRPPSARDIDRGAVCTL
jgi:hypothetical protein